MSDDFEDHCWKDLVPPEILDIYSHYQRKTFVGPSPALLAIGMSASVVLGNPSAISGNTPGFVAKATDLGSVDVPNNYLDAAYGGTRYSLGDEMQTRTTFSTIRVGVNYKFDTFAPSDFAVAE